VSYPSIFCCATRCIYISTTEKHLLFVFPFPLFTMDNKEALTQMESLIRSALAGPKFPGVSFLGIEGKSFAESNYSKRLYLIIGYRAKEEYYDPDDLYRYLSVFIRDRPIEITWMRNLERLWKFRVEDEQEYYDRLLRFYERLSDASPVLQRDPSWRRRNLDFLSSWLLDSGYWVSKLWKLHSHEKQIKSRSA
jgi:hypothetical protein